MKGLNVIINIMKPEKNKVEIMEWGNLTWFASKELCNCKGVTVGKCIIKPGCSNPRHVHPNCDEVLHVLEGTILHTYAGEELKMDKGDTIIIPANIPHNAINIGETDAVLSIVFSTGQRQTIGE